MASIKDVDTLSTVALALAVIAFVAQLIVFVVQTSAANQQMLQSRELHSELVRLLGEMGERARGTEATVTNMNERLLEAALGKALGQPDGSGSDAQRIAAEVASMMSASRPSANPADTASPFEIKDRAANEEARQILLTFPDQVNSASIEELEQLPSVARRALKEFGQDELRYAGTEIGVGRGLENIPGGDTLLLRGLIEPTREFASIYRLSRNGREAARLLLAPGAPPEPAASRLAPLRDVG